MNQETWKFINSFAPWLAATGTISAVVVSLYLARTDRRLRLDVSAGLRLMISQGDEPPFPEYLSIRVVNVGRRDAQITAIGWKAGIFSRQQAIQTTNPEDRLSSPLPVRLRDGEEANYLIPLSEEADWLNSFAAKMIGHSWISVRVYFVKLQIFTSAGNKFQSRIEKGLRERLIQAITGKKPSKPTEF